MPEIPNRGLRRRMVAAGIVVAVALCLSWMPVRGLTLGAAWPERHAAGTAARLLAGLGDGGTECSGVAALAGRGLHGAFAVPGNPCGSYQRLRPPGRPSGPSHDIRVLAFRHRAAAEPAWSERNGCITGEAALRMARLGGVVIDPAQPGASARGPADPVLGATPGSSRLPGMFSGSPALTCVRLGADGPRPGAGGPARWYGAFSGSGGQLSCGDRASLPGRSPRYHLIWLVCGQCGTEMALLFYDQGDLPLCVGCPDGQMEVRQ